MGIGANIQATRQAAGLMQEQLATEVGVSRQTVAKWEAGVDAVLEAVRKGVQ